MQDNEDILNFILDFLRRDMPASVIDTWFDDAGVARIDGDTLVMSTTAEFKRSIILERYSEPVSQALYELFGNQMGLSVVVSEPGAPIAARPDAEQNDYGFDSFVVGESNKFAAAAAKAVADSPGQAYNPLFIYGGSGLGKTHLLHAIKLQVRQSYPDYCILMFSAELFTNELVEAIQNKTANRFHEKYRSANLLLVDDIQFIGGRNFSQEEFFHTFNSLYEKGYQIALTSDKPPKEMPAFEDRLRTRFESGLIVDIQPPDFETRMAIVKSKAQRLGVPMPEDVLVYLANSLTSNVRQLEGTVKKIAAWRGLMNSPVNMSTAERAMADMIRESPGLNPTPAMIIAEMSSFYGVDEREILGKNRQAEVSNARQMAMYLIRELTDMSLKDIGSKVFRRDHTTVMYACEKLEALRKTDQATDNIIRMLIENIRGK